MGAVMKSLLNKSAVKDYAREMSAYRTMANGEPRFKRVSPDFLLLMESKLKEMIKGQIHHRPSAGRTL